MHPRQNPGNAYARYYIITCFICVLFFFSFFPLSNLCCVFCVFLCTSGSISGPRVLLSLILNKINKLRYSHTLCNVEPQHNYMLFCGANVTRYTFINAVKENEQSTTIPQQNKTSHYPCLLLTVSCVVVDLMSTKVFFSIIICESVQITTESNQIFLVKGLGYSFKNENTFMAFWVILTDRQTDQTGEQTDTKHNLNLIKTNSWRTSREWRDLDFVTRSRGTGEKMTSRWRHCRWAESRGRAVETVQSIVENSP